MFEYRDHSGRRTQRARIAAALLCALGSMLSRTASAQRFEKTNKRRSPEVYLQDAANAAFVYFYAEPPSCSLVTRSAGARAPSGVLLALAGHTFALRRNSSC
jgi:hypothetical protein